MGAAVSSVCVSRKNHAITDEAPSKIPIQSTPDVYQLVPQLLSMEQTEFKRIYKQSKKSKYTKRLLSKMDSHPDVDDFKLELTDVPPFKLTDSFIVKSKSLLNSASLLSLVILKDIIFKIHVRSRYQQYTANYDERQLQQRSVDIEELIMIHHGCISSLYTTITILLFIGYETLQLSAKLLVLRYRDLSFLDEIKFHISLKEKLGLSASDYEEYKLCGKRYKLYETLDGRSTVNTWMDPDASLDDVYLLVSGFLRLIPTAYHVISDVIALCIKFYLIPNDTNYCHMLSFSERGYPYSFAMKLDVFNISSSRSYSLNISGLASEGTHYMYLVRNISLPRWIKQDIVDLGGERTIYDERYFRVMNSKHLCVMYDQITYQHYDDDNTNKQVLIVFDPQHPEYGGYNIEFAKSFALNLYLWKADRKIFHRLRNSIICLSAVGNQSSLCEYDIDENKYSALNTLKCDRCEGAGMCLFDDDECKLLLCGGHEQNTLKSCEVYGIQSTCTTSVADMNLARMHHGMLYEKELQQIIVGGGQDKDIFFNSATIKYYNKYRYLTPHTVEILDLNKNVWKLIECKTTNGYASNPYLWYDNANPFVINIFNSYLSYSGKRANHCEFMDLREQRKWYQNHDINQYLKQNHTSHISMF
eukprot:1036962_1